MKSCRPFLFVVVLGGIALVSCSSDDPTTQTDVTEASVVQDTASSLPTDDANGTAIPETTVADPVVRISVTVGLDSSPDRVEEVSLGREVALTLSNPDADDEFHLHGYDLGGGVTKKGEPKTFTFTATEAGDFELESHVTGDVLVVVKVS